MIRQVFLFLFLTFSFIQGCQFEDVVYEYYEDGSVKSTTEIIYDWRNKVKLPHGIKRKFYPSGQIEEISYWERGLKKDTSLLFHQNGELKVKAPFRNGYQAGWTLKYDSTGNLVSKILFEEEEMSEQIIYYPDGSEKIKRKIIEGGILKYYEYTSQGAQKTCYLMRNDTLLYFKEYSEVDGSLQSIYLPISIQRSEDSTCFRLKHSVYLENLAVGITFSKESIGHISDLEISEGQEICIINERVGENALFCEIVGNEVTGCLPINLDE
jgi:hypothetical protein